MSYVLFALINSLMLFLDHVVMAEFAMIVQLML